MPGHKSAIKRMRQDAVKRARNRSLKAAVKTAAKKVRQTSGADEVAKIMPGAASIIDRAAKKQAIHWKTAARLKSRLARSARPKSA
ncbi:MAG: 30S ribosomal protein S20 [bacterium]